MRNLMGYTILHIFIRTEKLQGVTVFCVCYLKLKRKLEQKMNNDAICWRFSSFHLVLHRDFNIRGVKVMPTKMNKYSVSKLV